MKEKMYELLSMRREQEELSILEPLNRKTQSQFGLALTQDETKELIVSRNESLKKYHRVEFGRGILDRLIYTFCDSQYISQDSYGEALVELLDIFYQFKNESADRVTDDELLAFMKEQFETVCCGDTAYLEETCLVRFAKAVRAGYEGHHASAGREEYEQFSEEQRWDSDVYHDVLKELFW